jgi:hypothetical protein
MRQSLRKPPLISEDFIGECVGWRDLIRAFPRLAISGMLGGWQVRCKSVCNGRKTWQCCCQPGEIQNARSVLFAEKRAFYWLSRPDFAAPDTIAIKPDFIVL